MACENLHSSMYTRKYFYLKNSSSFIHRRLLITSDIADIFSTNPSICTYFYLCQPVEILTSSRPMLYTLPLIDIRSFMAYEKSVQTSILKVYNFLFHAYVQYSITRGRLFHKDERVSRFFQRYLYDSFLFNLCASKCNDCKFLQFLIFKV